MKRITALLLALGLLLALPASTTAHITGSLNKWTSTPSGTYSYFIPVCDRGFADGAQEDRIIDAINEWNEINGELRFSWSNHTDGQCDIDIISAASWVQIHWTSFIDNTLGQTTRTMSGSVLDDCTIEIDSNNILSTWGAYTWYTGTGSPSSSQVDLESVLVHELGHCVSIWGHSTHEGTYVMHCSLNPSPDDCTSKNPKGIEKDELLQHDKDLYISLYGNTH